MATLSLDTYQFIKGLTQAGIPESQAQAIAAGLAKVSLEQVTTKQDLTTVKQDLQLEIKQVKIDLLKWMIPLLLGQTVVFAALVKWVLG